jgi:predicted ribosome quality control (RQC) complex YloA/Tae2 family protein
LGSNKIIVGRDESENRILSALSEGKFTYLEVPDCGSPLTLLQGRLTKKALVTAARLTARYSDTREVRTTVYYRRGSASGKLDVDKMTDEETSSLRISRTRQKH